MYIEHIFSWFNVKKNVVSEYLSINYELISKQFSASSHRNVKKTECVIFYSHYFYGVTYEYILYYFIRKASRSSLTVIQTILAQVQFRII